MMEGTWSYALAAVRGTSHARAGLPCQDVCACQILHDVWGQAILAAAVADGAGSASRSQEGASRTCDLLIQQVAAYIREGKAIRDLTRVCVEQWLCWIRLALTHRAKEEGIHPRDFACTVLAAFVGPAEAAFLQVGDGVIVLSPDSDADQYCWVFWPQKGEYANTTFFITDDDVAEHFEFDVVTDRVAEIALLSDGLERLALDFRTRTAYAPFFRPLFLPLRASHPEQAAELSLQLARFLDSQAVNRRTDDDKAIVLATRRSPADTPVSNHDEQLDAPKAGLR